MNIEQEQAVARDIHAIMGLHQVPMANMVRILMTGLCSNVIAAAMIAGKMHNLPEVKQELLTLLAQLFDITAKTAQPPDNSFRNN